MKASRRAAFILAALAGLAGHGQSALAQTGTGRSGMSTSGDLGNVKILRDLDEYGRCFAKNNRIGALALIATRPASKEENEVYRRLAKRDQLCLYPGTEMFASVVYIRGAIAEGLLDAGGVPANLLLPAPAPAQVTSLSEAARCYTSGHRPQVQALLKMKAGTREELAAITALWGGFRTCLPRRANVKLNALWIRFLLAEALLRTSGPAASGRSQ
jgi:hypothetical protein